MHYARPIAEVAQPLARQFHRRGIAIHAEELRRPCLEHRPRVTAEPDRAVHEHPAARRREVLEHFRDHDRLVHVTSVKR